jgi:hypothetical protein
MLNRAWCAHYASQLPEYFSWGYLVRNQLATDHGQRMFYTDETGETVPASDDEDADQVRSCKLVMSSTV